MASILPFPNRGYSASLTLGTTPAGQPIQVTQEDLCQGCYLVGVQGSGKTSLFEQVIYEQSRQNKSIIVLAVHSAFINNIILRIAELIFNQRKPYLLDLTDYTHPFSFNLFACHNPQDLLQRLAVREQVMHAFTKLWPEVERGLYFKDILRIIVATLIECPELTMAHVERLLTNRLFRLQYIQSLTNRDTIELWNEFEGWPPSQKAKECRPFISRVRDLLDNELIKYIICQKQGRIGFREAIEQREIILIHLPVLQPAYKTAAQYIGTFLMAAIYGATFSFADLPEGDRPGFTLIVDEFQNFATEDYATLFSQGRQYGVQQFLAHQYRAQLDEERMGKSKDAALTAHTIIAMQTTLPDSKALAGKFKELKRRPTNIQRDVVLTPNLQLEKHPSVRVKEFYHNTVRKLQEAAKMRIETERDYYSRKRDVLPLTDFGFGSVSFDPGEAKAALDKLNDLLYYTQLEARIDKTRQQAFIQAYGKLNGIVCAAEHVDEMKVDEMILHLEVKRVRIEEGLLPPLRKELSAVTKEEEQAKLRRENEYRRHLEETLARCEKAKQAKLDQLKNQITQLKRDLEEAYKQHFSASEREILTSCDEEIKVNAFFILGRTSPKMEDGPTYAHTPLDKFPITEQVRVYKEYMEDKHSFDSFWEKLSNPELKLARNKDLWNEYIKLYRKRHNLNLLQKQEHIYKAERDFSNKWRDHYAYDDSQRQAQNKYQKALEEDGSTREAQTLKTKHTVLQAKVVDLERQERELRERIPQMQKEQKFTLRINELFTPVLKDLIKEPIAFDKAEVDSETVLANLKPRFALAAIGDRVFEMQTIDLDQAYGKKERLQASYPQRIAQIREQTRQKYCRPRSQVEDEIYGLFTVKAEPKEPEEEQKAEKQERQPTLEHDNNQQTDREPEPRPKPEQPATENDEDWRLYQGE